MFDTRTELKKWKEELMARRHELLSKKEQYGRFLSCGEHSDINDVIAILTMKICIVDRELQMCGGDKDESSCRA